MLTAARPLVTEVATLGHSEAGEGLRNACPAWRLVELLGVQFHLPTNFDPPTHGENLNVFKTLHVPVFENISISHLTAETKCVNKREPNIF